MSIYDGDVYCTFKNIKNWLFMVMTHMKIIYIFSRYSSKNDTLEIMLNECPIYPLGSS